MKQAKPKRGRPRLNEGPRVPRQIKFRLPTYELLMKLMGAEQQLNPKRVVARQDVVEMAILHYAEQRHPHLVSSESE